MRPKANILWISSAMILSFASEQVEGFLGPHQQQQQWRLAQPDSERRNRFDSNPTATATTRSSIAVPIMCGATTTSSFTACNNRISGCNFDSESRRTWLVRSIGTASTTAVAGLVAFSSRPARGNDFAPGGTLVDYKVGVTVGNLEASPSRKPDNSNVLFDRDFYFKFGTAAPWISPGSSDFPKTIPFVKSQQRYDALKKYQDRVLLGVANIRALENAEPSAIADPTRCRRLLPATHGVVGQRVARQRKHGQYQ